MRPVWNTALALLGAVVFGGCAQHTEVDLTLVLGGALAGRGADVRTLVLTVAGDSAAFSRRIDTTGKWSGGRASVVYRPGIKSGTLTFDADLHDAADQSLGKTSGMATISAAHAVALTLTVGSGNNGDGFLPGGGDLGDGGGGNNSDGDMTGVAPGDMTASPDLAMFNPTPAPRPTAPLSTSFALTTKPTLRWLLAPLTDGARLQICADRACTSVISTTDIAGTSYKPGSDLPAGVVYWRLFGKKGSEVGSATSATWELIIPRRDTGIDGAHGSMPDFDGDGHPEIFTNSDAFPYQVTVYSGAAAGPGATGTVIPGGYDQGFGRVAVSAGDINGDGYADFAIASTLANKIDVYLGGKNGISTVSFVTIATGCADWSQANSCMSTAGDLDGDGYANLLVADGGLGRVFLGGPAGLGSGTAPAPATTFTEPGAVSTSPSLVRGVAGGFDVDGDGHPDAVFVAPCSTSTSSGAQCGAGVAYYFKGSASGLGATPSPTATFTIAGSHYFGWAAAGADVNADGYMDVVIGEAGIFNTAGHVYVYHGGAGGLTGTPSPNTTITEPGAPVGAGFGGSLGSALDFDGDGVDDVIVGSVGSHKAYLYLGTTNATGLGATPSPTSTLSDSDAGDTTFINAAFSSGSIRASGHDDVVVMRPNATGAFVFYGSGRPIAATLNQSLSRP